MLKSRSQWLLVPVLVSLGLANAQAVTLTNKQSDLFSYQGAFR
jgi:hypothetical protein